MAQNTFKQYVEEIISHVLNHTQQRLENGCCNCCSGIDNPNSIQTICLPAERLASVMRGDPQNYSEDTGVSPYKFLWKENTSL